MACLCRRPLLRKADAIPCGSVISDECDKDTFQVQQSLCGLETDLLRYRYLQKSKPQPAAFSFPVFPPDNTGLWRKYGQLLILGEVSVLT